MMNDKQKLWVAYQSIGNGRPYVMIHAMRSRLKWDRNRFDSILKSLAKSGDIELTGGDPSKMSRLTILTLMILGINYFQFAG